MALVGAAQCSRTSVQPSGLSKTFAIWGFAASPAAVAFSNATWLSSRSAAAVAEKRASCVALSRASRPASWSR